MWQTLDVSPEYPRVYQFLDHWRREIEAVIHSVTVSGVELIAPAKVRSIHDIGLLH